MCLPLTSLNMKPSGSIQVAENFMISSFLVTAYFYCVYIYHSSFSKTHLLGILVVSITWFIALSTVMNIGMHRSFQKNVFVFGG